MGTDILSPIMILPPVGRRQKMLMSMVVQGFWVAERIGAEALRDWLGNQVLMRLPLW